MLIADMKTTHPHWAKQMTIDTDIFLLIAKLNHIHKVVNAKC